MKDNLGYECVKVEQSPQNSLENDSFFQFGPYLSPDPPENLAFPPKQK